MKKTGRILIGLALIIFAFTNSSNVFAVNSKNDKGKDLPKAKQIYFDSICTGKDGHYGNYYEPNTYILTTDNELWGSGINANGQLGIKGKSRIEKLVKIISDVESFHTSNEAYHVIKTNGELWAWGKNTDGILGCGDAEIVWEPTKILDNVVEIYKSRIGLFYALTKDKELYSWGTVWGLKDGEDIIKNKPKNKPTKILENVTEIGKTFYGPEHAIVNNGELWTWGENSGAGTDKYVDTPAKILDDVDKVEFYDYYASLFYAVKKNGELWGWGGGEHDFLGDGKRIYANKPKKIMDNVKDVYPLYGESFLVTKNGELWGWGHNIAGILGDGSASFVSKPTKIMDDVSQFLSGYANFYALKKNGDLWAWGDDYRDSNKLNERYSIISLPRKVMSDVKSIGLNRYSRTGIRSPFVYKNNDELWAWGKYLPNKIEHDVEKARIPKKIKDNVDYAEYDFNFTNYLITKDKELWVWGMHNDDRMEKVVDNVKEVLMLGGLKVITEEGDFWSINGKIAENVVSADIAYELKKGGGGRKSYYGFVKDNGEVWITANTDMRSWITGRLSNTTQSNEPIKIFPH